MKQLVFEQLLEAGCHFGHLKRKWNPNMAPYIFMEKNGIHVINLHKTIEKLEEAANAIRQIAKSNKKILFVGTKKQAKEIIANAGKATNMPYTVERWPGGLLTNFATIRKSVKKMTSLEKMMEDDTFNNISKRERLQIERAKAKLEKNLGSIRDLTKLPSALFVVDINKEHIAVAEARKLNIPIFAIVDTNANPLLVDFPIPANDDAAKSIGLIVDYIVEAIKEGLNERQMDKDTTEYEEDKTRIMAQQSLEIEEKFGLDPKLRIAEEEQVKGAKIKIDSEEEETENNKMQKKFKK